MKKLLKLYVNMPLPKKIRAFIYKKLGVKTERGVRIYRGAHIHGNYNNLYCKEYSEINEGCFILPTANIIIGKNTAIAYRVTILTSANPNFPHNELSQTVYPPVKKPVIIGDNVWIGACSVILPGVTIGDFCVVAAGSVVTKDIPSHTVVAGCPARPIKKI